MGGMGSVNPPCAICLHLPPSFPGEICMRAPKSMRMPYHMPQGFRSFVVISSAAHCPCRRSRIGAMYFLSEMS